MQNIIKNKGFASLTHLAAEKNATGKWANERLDHKFQSYCLSKFVNQRK